MAETKQQIKKKGGRGKLRGGDGKNFSKDYQPTTAARKRGWAKKKILKDMLDLTTNATLGLSATNYRALAANYLGIKEKDVTIKMIMEYRQIEKAILSGNTFAFTAIMDRAYGKPPQQVQLSNADGDNLFPQPVFKLPDGTEIPL